MWSFATFATWTVARLTSSWSRDPPTSSSARWADAPIDRGLRYLQLRFPAAEAGQLSAVGTKDFLSPEGIRASPPSSSCIAFHRVCSEGS